MKFARVIGNVVATIKDRSFQGKKLLLLQPVDGHGRSLGTPIVGMDAVGAGWGEMVLYVGGKEASFPFLPEEVPVDAGVVGIIDALERPLSRPPEAEHAVKERPSPSSTQSLVPSEEGVETANLASLSSSSTGTNR